MGDTFSPEADHEAVKRWIENSVAPKTRENIQDILHIKGLTVYDPWLLFKANGGKNANDYSTIHFLRTEK